MNLVEINDVTIENNPIHFDLKIHQNEQLGLKMDNQASKLLLDLLSGKIYPSSGSFLLNTDVMFKRNTDGLYDQMTVKEYFKLFADLANSKADMNQMMATFYLTSEINIKISKLTIDQRERLHLLRIYLFQPQLIIIESPIHNLTNEGIVLYLKLINILRSNATTIAFIAPTLDELRRVSTVCYQVNDNQLKKVENSQELKIISHSAGKIVYFTTTEIDFVESINGVSNLYVKGQYYQVNLTLDELTQKLMDFGFFRCHRSYLVNLKRIAQILNPTKNNYSLLLKNKEQNELPLSRTKVTEIKQLLSTVQL